MFNEEEEEYDDCSDTSAAAACEGRKDVVNGGPCDDRIWYPTRTLLKHSKQELKNDECQFFLHLRDW